MRRQTRLERIRHADLRAEKIEARVRIGLAAVGKMLVENAGGRFPMIVDFVGNADGGKDVESEILTLRAEMIGVAVDPAEADATRDVRNETRVWFHEIVTQPNRNAVVEILRPAHNRFRHAENVDLVEASQPTVLVHRAQPPARGDELARDLIAVGIADDAEQVSRLRRHFEARRVQWISRSKMGRKAIAARVSQRRAEN